MGALVMAAKITHVPSIVLSMQEGKHHGIRRAAEDGLRELGRRAAELGVDTFVVCDTHWLNRVGFHINGNARHSGVFTSHEVPHFISDLVYDYPGDGEFAKLIAEETGRAGRGVYVHERPSLGLDYGTLVPMTLMYDESRPASVVTIGANMHSSPEENRVLGEAVARAAAKSGRRVALLASGSLSHQFPDNAVAHEFFDEITDPINRRMDHTVLQLWRHGRTDEFLSMLDTYNARFDGEGAMADTALLFGALGWDSYRGHGEELCDYFPSTGTGQTIVDFPLAS